MYMKHAKKPVQGYDVLRFLLQDRKLPRAYYHCLAELALCIQAIESPDPENTVTPMPQLTQLITAQAATARVYRSVAIVSDLGQ